MLLGTLSIITLDTLYTQMEKMQVSYEKDFECKHA